MLLILHFTGVINLQSWIVLAFIHAMFCAIFMLLTSIIKYIDTPSGIFHINTHSKIMAMLVFLGLFLFGCASTQYIPTDNVQINCPPPPHCPELYIVRQDSVVHDLLARKEQYLICRAGVDSYYQCLDKKGK